MSMWALPVIDRLPAIMRSCSDKRDEMLKSLAGEVNLICNFFYIAYINNETSKVVSFISEVVVSCISNESLDKS